MLFSVRLIVCFLLSIVFRKAFAEVELDVERDSTLTTPELITEYGFPAETHNVTTEDGYILELHRIAAPGKRPVLIVHGFLDSSSTWVRLGPHQGLAYFMYNSSYDVWMANARGNVYSKDHIEYNRNGWRSERKKYWDFSFHVIGIYDLPATIDYILEKTNKSKVHYIGHSQGCTAFFIMTSERPEYNKKIAFNRSVTIFQRVTEFIGFYDVSRQSTDLLTYAQSSGICYLQFLKSTLFCNNNFSPLAGNITNHVNRSSIPLIKAHFPAGASVKQLYHFGQIIRSRRFAQYDHGSYRNLRMYGQPTPPEYNLKNCTVPVGIFYSDTDGLVEAEGVKQLSDMLQNLVEIRRVKDDTFNHLDFAWASDAKVLVYSYIIGWMKSVDDSF